MKKIIIFAISSLLMLTLGSCKQNENADINIKVNDSMDLNIGQFTNCESQNDSIAYVSSDGVLSGVNPGVTYITLNQNGLKEKLKVEVTTDTSKETVDDETVASQLGYGYSVINGRNLNIEDCSNAPILDFEKIKKDNGYRVIEGCYNKSLAISGDSMESFISDYNSKIMVGAKASYKKYFSGSVNTDFSSIAKGSTATKSEYLKFFSSTQTHTATLTIGPSKLVDYLDEDFKDIINDNDYPVADIIESYGTHVVFSAKYGGRLDFTYYLSSTSQEDNTTDIKDISAHLETEIFGFEASADANVNQTVEHEAASKNIVIQEKVAAIGGGLTDMSSKEKVASNYSTWVQSIKQEPVMMGMLNANSLYPIWNFVDSTNIDRKNEFIQYINDNTNSSYLKLLDEYALSDVYSQAIEFGKWPQSIASKEVSNYLVKNIYWWGENNGFKYIHQSDTFSELYSANYNQSYAIYKDKESNVSIDGYDYKPQGYLDNFYIFNIEPIKWQYIGRDSLGQKIYISDMILDASYMDSDKWETSSLRTYLNNDFYNYAFKDQSEYELGTIHSGRCSDAVSIVPANFDSGNIYKMTDYALFRGATNYCYTASSNMVDGNINPIIGLKTTILNKSNNMIETKTKGYESNTRNGVRLTIAIK